MADEKTVENEFKASHAFDFVGKDGSKLEIWTDKQTRGRLKEGDSGEFFAPKKTETGGYGLTLEQWGKVIDPQVLVEEGIEPRVTKLCKKITGWLNGKIAEAQKTGVVPTSEQIAAWFSEKFAKFTIAEEGKRALKALIQQLNTELTKYMDFSKPENKEKFLNTAMQISQTQVKLDALENEDEPAEQAA